jgi:hypothetical protein
MSQGQKIHDPCPLCGRVTRAHSRIVIADVEPVSPRGGRLAEHATVICRDCAFAMVVRSHAATLKVAV